MITIEQLLESVDLDFEPRWVTKNKDGEVYVWELKPRFCTAAECWVWDSAIEDCGAASYEHLKLSEFENKPWSECIYEVPRKVVISKMEKIEKLNLLNDSALLWGKKINELVVAVNELKENKGA